MVISEPAVPVTRNSAAAPGVYLDIVLGTPGNISPKVRELVSLTSSWQNPLEERTENINVNNMTGFRIFMITSEANLMRFKNLCQY
jgi:hypothetical protein